LWIRNSYNLENLHKTLLLDLSTTLSRIQILEIDNYAMLFEARKYKESFLAYKQERISNISKNLSRIQAIRDIKNGGP